ncbi:MAG: hypothetical protein Q7R56_00630 [Nanoarchaeota archaeon]|nr:hypothetical protein [Nanoarchaeota archaeon]
MKKIYDHLSKEVTQAAYNLAQQANPHPETLEVFYQRGIVHAAAHELGRRAISTGQQAAHYAGKAAKTTRKTLILVTPKPPFGQGNNRRRILEALDDIIK